MELDKDFENYMYNFCATCNGTFAPLAAFLGGFISQEIIKAITYKYMPLKQLFYTNCVEVIPEIEE